jgi:hypothetical protein
MFLGQNIKKKEPNTTNITDINGLTYMYKKRTPGGK